MGALSPDMGVDDESESETRASDEEILAVFDRSDADALRPRDLVDELSMDRDVVDDRLDDLAERGLVVSADDEVDPRDETWTLAEDVGDELLDDVETGVEAQVSVVDETRPQDEHAGEPPEPDTPPEEPSSEAFVDDAIAAFDPPGSAEEQERGRAAVRAAYTYLRKRGTASREDFEADVFSTNPAGYDDPDEGWWDEVIRPGLDEIPTVDPVDDSGEAWHHSGRSDPTADDVERTPVEEDPDHS